MSVGEWRQCIEYDCGLPLTQEFIQKRLTVFRQLQHEETLRFIHHYGETHLNLNPVVDRSLIDQCYDQ
ncbi:hypothetical protein SAMN05720354_11764 [Nitrosospira sp. Nsp1]|nr:hypothetical protein SAMN05720354_11764 [Nitrosospira sp. Nsp1]